MVRRDVVSEAWLVILLGAAHCAGDEIDGHEEQDAEEQGEQGHGGGDLRIRLS